MSYIYTATGKWEDNWFLYLSNDAKVLFYYISEKCNNAGFYEINKKLMLVQTNMNEARSRECFVEIKKAYVMSADRKTIWLKNFIKYQRKLPLKENVSNHKQIINFLKLNLENTDKFPNNKEIIELLPISIQPKPIEIIKEKEKEEKSEPVKRFVKPTIEDIRAYMEFKLIPNADYESNNFFNFYESKGWKVGKNPMKSWKSAIDGTWSKAIKEKNKDKFSVLENGYQSNKNVDWNEKLKN
jgi:hypothetical protein